MSKALKGGLVFGLRGKHIPNCHPSLFIPSTENGRLISLTTYTSWAFSRVTPTSRPLNATQLTRSANHSMSNHQEGTASSEVSTALLLRSQLMLPKAHGAATQRRLPITPAAVRVAAARYTAPLAMEIGMRWTPASYKPGNASWPPKLLRWRPTAL
ncbi:hypothetical protein L209DRAFT_569898 [Thermothelomyces heterothallicus CBS 203.75]